jgi:hypothetical protein
MPCVSAHQPQTFWLTRAQQLVRFSGRAWSLQYFLKFWPWLCALCALGLLLLRSAAIDTAPLWLLAVVVTFALCSWALLRAAPRKFSEADALILLEDKLQLNSRLSAARVGICAWPPEMPLPQFFTLRKDAFVVRAFSGPLLLALVALIPVEHQALTSQARALQAPLPVTEVEVLLEKLAGSEIIEQQSLETFEQRLQEFKERAEESWYEHEALEAADSLQEELGGGLADLSAHGQQLAEALERLAQGGLNQSEREALAQTAQELLGKLDTGKVQLDKQLSQQLSQLAEQLGAGGLSQALQEETGAQAGNSSALGRIPLTQELRQKLRELDQRQAQQAQGSGQNQQQGQGGKQQGQQGQQGAQGQQTQQGTSQGSCSGGSSDGPMCSSQQQSAGGSGQQGEQSGQAGESGSSSSQATAQQRGQEQAGGVGRGPGAAPLNLSEKSPQLTSNRIEQMQAQQAQSELEPGELLSLERRAPEIDKSAPMIEGANAIAPGRLEGQQAAWQEEFTPEEEELLGRYFR